ncbi:MAG: hypothetical protein JST93_26850 [Acidobacteria bacterium]|nr:hypothetical protein [Acidobacteriota bacterium]
MKLALFFLSAGVALAQGPAATVQILTPSLRLLAGERVEMRAVIRDANGVERPNDIPIWSVNNTTLATMETNGAVTARALGLVTVTARIGGISTTTQLQILPKRIQITPPTATLTVGERLQFQAVAFDKNDQPLPNVTFAWSTSSGNGFTTNTSSVSAAGMLSTVATGNVLVRATINYNTSIPGFERQSQAIATLAIRPPSTYKLRKLFGNADMQPGPLRLRAKIVPLLGNDQGQVLFNAVLSGTANGPLLMDGRTTRLIAWGGMPGPAGQTSVYEFPTLALNNRGMVLAMTNVLFSGNVLYRINGDEVDPLFLDPMPLPGTESLSSPAITRNSLNDTGDFLMAANYRIANAGATYRALFRVPQRGFPDEVISTRDTLPGLPAGFTIDGDFGIAGNGAVFFSATAGAARALYVREYGQPKKVLAVGDALLGSTVARFPGNPFYLSNDGDLIAVVVLANNQTHMLRYSLKNLNEPAATLLLRSYSNVYRIHPELGVLFLGDGGKGYGVTIWNGGDTTAVFLQNSNASRLRGKPFPQIDYATMDASGDVTILGRSQDSPMEIFSVRAGQEAVPLMQAGDPVEVSAPINLINTLPGARMGPHHVLLGGRGSSLFESSEEGLKPAYVIGERYNTTALYTGSDTSNTQKVPGGEIYVTPTSGVGMFRMKGGEGDFLYRAGLTLATGTTANAAQLVRGNSAGDLIWQASTNRGDTRLILTRNGEHKTILTNNVYAPDPTLVEDNAVVSWGDMAIDETGRVMATLRFRDNSFALFLYTNGQWQRVLTPAESKIGGTVISSYSQVKAGGDAIYAVVSMPGIGNSLARHRNGNWEVAISVSDLLVTGHSANSIGVYEVNRNGDIFVQCNTNTQVLVVKKRDGKTHYIHMLNELTPEGDLLLRTSDYDIRDDGTVYFLGMSVLDEYAVYMAKPVN